MRHSDSSATKDDNLLQQVPDGGSVPNVEGLMFILRQFKRGLWALGGTDGCNCTNLSLQGLQVDVGCHKSDHSIRVWSRCGTPVPDGLRQIAVVVGNQFRTRCGGDPGYAEGYKVRFCSNDDDRVSWCCHCHATLREVPDEYLCPPCRSRPSDAFHDDPSDYYPAWMLDWTLP